MMLIRKLTTLDARVALEQRIIDDATNGSRNFPSDCSVTVPVRFLSVLINVDLDVDINGARSMTEPTERTARLGNDLDV